MTHGDGLRRAGQIDTDEKLVDVFDELSHLLKPLRSDLGLAFRKILREFIVAQKLDGDPDMFASLSS